jgi:hybrid polyketide synthase/nonribosomal peptide synthetase ACE1
MTVATIQEPTAAWVASILAILKIGAIYVPLDLSMAPDRLKAILKDCQARWVLVDNESGNYFEELELPDTKIIDVSQQSLIYSQPFPFPSTKAKDHAMILYTSGSTNTPKGIVLRHQGISNLIESVEDTYMLNSETVSLQQSAATFDMCYAQIFMSLCHGGSVFLLPRILRGDPVAITELIFHQGITFTNATPTEYSSWLRYGNTSLLQHSKWQTAISGGEHVRPSLCQQFQDLNLATLHVYNSYGPTEITWGVTSGELILSGITQKDDLSAGFTLPNYSVYLVDENLHSVPPGVSGEIYVGGPGVAAGYLNNPSMDLERFMPDIFAPKSFRDRGWVSMHRTGDTGRWNHDGTLIIEGRIGGDVQIKLRGFRFDLRDVEQAIIDVADGTICEAAVSVRRSSPESAEFLIAHVLLDQKTNKEASLELLKSIPSMLPLPNYMLPSAVLSIGQLPRTTSAKLDRQAVASLPLPALRDDTDTEDLEFSDTQRRLRQAWLAVLPLVPANPIQMTTDFFHIGGTSLLLMQLQNEISKEFGIKMPLAKLLKSSMLGSMALLVDGKADPEPICWDLETQLNETMIRFAQNSQAVTAVRSTVILTGATGFLGRALLKELLNDESVREVHCVGVRHIATRTELLGEEKVFLHEGDIRLPFLGMTSEAATNIFARAHCVIHAAAEISHRRAYHSLRSPNFESLKQIVEISLPRRIPIHYISSSQVGILYSRTTGHDVFPPISVANCLPSADGLDGYTATKWAAERFLERLSSHYKGTWPIYVHRPSLILRTSGPDTTIIHNIAEFSSLIGGVPNLPNYRGYLNYVDMDIVVKGIIGAIKEPELETTTQSAVPQTGVKFRHYVNKGESVRLEEVFQSDLPLELRGQRTQPLDDMHSAYKKVPVDQWTGKAGALGLAPEIIDWVNNASAMGERIFPRLVI